MQKWESGVYIERFWKTNEEPKEPKEENIVTVS